MKIDRLSICVLTAAFFLSAAGAFGNDSPAPDANRKTLEDAGFKCGELNGGWSCSKEGETLRGCDNDGKCSISPGSNANQRTLEKAGFKCEKGGVADKGCSKPGEKDRVCDNAGSCFIP